MSPTVTAIVAAGLRAEPRDHRRGLLDPVDSDSTGRQREPDAPRADGQLQRRTSSGQLVQTRDGLGLVAAHVVVVHGGGVLSEALPRVEVLHGRQYGTGGPSRATQFVGARGCAGELPVVASYGDGGRRSPPD